MKTITIFLAAATFLAACNENNSTKKIAKKGAIDGAHQHTESKNVMMKAMDESMLAMHKVKESGNADYDFAAMMIPHHEGALTMAKAQMESGKSTALLNFSQRVIAGQEKEIAALEDFLKKGSLAPSKNAEKFKEALNNSMKPMMEGMAKAKLNGDVDHDFVALMIPHHQSAVDMAKAYLPFAENAKLKKMAIEIYKAQEEEIKWLKEQL
ncbi:MAG: DUF305 domain-containing protein [Chitinophagaceae bacterium]|nr:MAG: DUF305 domain-containing protein [Chitinophagaceae bacterium]